MLSPLALFLVGPLLLRSFAFAPLLLHVERQCRFAFGLRIGGATWTSRRPTFRNLSRFARPPAVADIRRKVGVFPESSTGPNRAPQDDARRCHRGRDYIWIVYLPRRALVKKIAICAPGLESSLHGGRCNRLIEETKGGHKDLQLSYHRPSYRSRRQQPSAL